MFEILLPFWIMISEVLSAVRVSFFLTLGNIRSYIFPIAAILIQMKSDENSLYSDLFKRNP